MIVLRYGVIQVAARNHHVVEALVQLATSSRLLSTFMSRPD